MAQIDEKAARTAPETTPNPAQPVPQGEIPVLPPPGSGAPATQIILQDVETVMRELDIVFDPCTVLLTEAQRKSLVSAQVRNHGFIDVAFHSATDNPTLVPTYFNMAAFTADHTDFENKQRIYDLARAFCNETADSLAVAADRVYHDALRYYEALKSEARNFPGASAERDKLADYFRHHRPEGGEPTEAQVERDVRSLLHGTKEGEVVVRNVTPRASGGVHEVADEVSTGRGAVRVEAGEKK